VVPISASRPALPRAGGQLPRRSRGAPRHIVLAAALLLLGSLLSACGGGDSRTVLTFFQFKPEAQSYFVDLARQFEAANPDIRVVVTTPADPETALRTRLVKNDVPDVMSLNANGTFGEFASASIFRDFSDDPVLSGVEPQYIDVIGDLGRAGEGEVNGVPFAANASGLLYNQELFEQYGAAVPTTFDELFQYTQPDPLSKGYEDGTAAFARGESAMLLLGSYAVPQIRANDPAFTVGSMALPATDDATKTVLVSGVDVVFTVSRNGAHPEESQRLIDFLMQPDVVAAYCDAQVAIPTLTGQTNDDPALAGIQDYITDGRIVGFTDHQFIPAIPLGPLLQEFLIDGDTEAFLENLDSAWDKVAKRRTWGMGANLA
jgi:raffinose/stachyose/melibiose transport system substrate-binding protein